MSDLRGQNESYRFDYQKRPGALRLLPFTDGEVEVAQAEEISLLSFGGNQIRGEHK